VAVKPSPVMAGELGDKGIRTKPTLKKPSCFTDHLGREEARGEKWRSWFRICLPEAQEKIKLLLSPRINRLGPSSDFVGRG